MSAPPNSGSTVRATRLLLVDDDPIVLRALRRLLVGIRPGWEIDMAESGDAARKLMAQRSYDVVVTDLQMPGLSGAALLTWLKAEHPKVMRVVHSSHVESLSLMQLDALAHAVIGKPGRPDQLLHVLEWAIEQRRRHQRDSVNGY